MTALEESTVTSLAADTIHLIKSAQVITSVSAVVKELTENALDSGTTLLTVRLEKYGLQRVEVKDNGTGISEADLQQVCRPHTTSKLTCFNDLDSLLSYGFRGEALSSLCQVGSVTLTTRQTGTIKGYTCDYGPEGFVVNKKVAAANPGTTVTVSNLFGCLPVRRQYHSDPRRCKEQLKRIEELLMAYSLAQPDLHVTLTHDKKSVYQKSPASSVEQALHAVFPGVARGLAARTEAELQVSVTAHLPDRQYSEPASALSRSSTDRLFILVNGRPVQHKQIEKAVKAHYSGGSEGVHGRYPIGMVSVCLPPDSVDVNLEPNKDRILFKDQDTVMKLVTTILTDLYGPLAAAVSGEDGLVCSLTHGTQQPVPDGETSSLDASISRQTLEVDRAKRINRTNASQNDGTLGSRCGYDEDDDFFSNNANKENPSNNSTNSDCSLLQSRKMSLKKTTALKKLVGERGVGDVGKSTYGKLKTGASSASMDVMVNSCSLRKRRFLSSTPPLHQTSTANNDPSFGSLSSIDILSIEDQTTLGEILSQDVASSPQDLPQANGNKSPRFLGDEVRDSLAAEGDVARSSSFSSSVNCLLTVADTPIDAAAWSKGHVWAQDGTNIQSVEVVGTGSTSAQHWPRHRSCSPPTESPAKRLKLSHDSSSCSASSAVSGVFSFGKQPLNGITAPTMGVREGSDGDTHDENTVNAALSVDQPSGSSTCEEINLRYSPPVTKTQRNLMVSQDDPCSPSVTHAPTTCCSTDGRMDTINAGVVVNRISSFPSDTGPNIPPSTDSTIAYVSTSNVTPQPNPYLQGSSTTAPLVPSANSPDRPSAAPNAVVGVSRPRGAKESSSDRRARQVVLSVSGTEAHGGQLVRKPVTPFAAFAKDIRNTVLSEFPGAAFTVLGREIASRWKALDAAGKARYEQLARVDVDRYQEEVRFVSTSVSSPSPVIKKEASPKVKKEPHALQRPWMERGITVQATVADIGRRLRRAADRAQNTVDTAEGYKVLGKIRYPSTIRSGIDDVTESRDVTGRVDESTSPAAANSPSVMCFVCLDPTRKRIVGLHGHGLQEVLLCYRLLERYSVPRKVLDEPLPFNASSLGDGNWRALLQLDHRPDDKGAFRVVTDHRLTDNGLSVALFPGDPEPGCITHGELQEVAASVAFFGLSDLQEVIMVLAACPSAPLIQTRPVKLRLWIQGECVRMIRDAPTLTSCEAVREKLGLWEHYKDTYYTTGGGDDGFPVPTGGPPVPTDGCSIGQGYRSRGTHGSSESVSSVAPANVDDIELSFEGRELYVADKLGKVNNINRKRIDGVGRILDNSSVSVETRQAKIPVRGLPDASACLHHKPIMHELYDLHELPGSQSRNKTQNQDPVTLY